jgi:hypothetical protein
MESNITHEILKIPKLAYFIEFMINDPSYKDVIGIAGGMMNLKKILPANSNEKEREMKMIKFLNRSKEKKRDKNTAS